MKGGGLGIFIVFVVYIWIGEDIGEGDEILLELDELDVFELDFVNLFFFWLVLFFFILDFVDLVLFCIVLFLMILRIFVGIFSGCWSFMFEGFFVVDGFLFIFDVGFFVCDVGGFDFFCLLDIFEVIDMFVYFVVLFVELLSVVGLGGLLLSEDGFLGFLRVVNLELVDWVLLSVIGEGKLDEWGDVVGGEDEGGWGGLGDCFKDDRFKLSFGFFFICVEKFLGWMYCLFVMILVLFFLCWIWVFFFVGCLLEFILNSFLKYL